MASFISCDRCYMFNNRFGFLQRYYAGKQIFAADVMYRAHYSRIAGKKIVCRNQCCIGCNKNFGPNLRFHFKVDKPVYLNRKGRKRTNAELSTIIKNRKLTIYEFKRRKKN